MSMETPGLSNVRPWVRFWARVLDISLYSLILALFFPALMNFSAFWQTHLAFHWPLFVHQLAALGLISLVTYIFIETILLTTVGTTLGKWILRVSLQTEQNQKLSFGNAFKRTFLVYFRGLALLIPIISLITLIYAYASLSSSGATSWDKECRTVITHQRIGFLRILIFIILLLFFAHLKSRAMGTEMITFKERVMYVCGIRG